jgi:hypothetical protein
MHDLWPSPGVTQTLRGLARHGTCGIAALYSNWTRELKC